MGGGRRGSGDGGCGAAPSGGAPALKVDAVHPGCLAPVGLSLQPLHWRLIRSGENDQGPRQLFQGPRGPEQGKVLLCGLGRSEPQFPRLPCGNGEYLQSPCRGTYRVSLPFYGSQFLSLWNAGAGLCWWSLSLWFTRPHVASAMVTVHSLVLPPTGFLYFTCAPG